MSAVNSTEHRLGCSAVVLAALVAWGPLAGAGPPDPPSDVWVAPGFRVEVFAVNLRGPEDMAWDPRGELIVLNALGRPGTVGEIVRLPVRPGQTLPLDAFQAPTLALQGSPFAPAFPISSLAIHPATGDVFLGERWGQHLYRLSRDGQIVLYASGFLRLPHRAVRFDGDGKLLVLDGHPGGRPPQQRDEGEEDTGPDDDPFLGPILYRVSVEGQEPLPRNVRYWRTVFPRDDEERKALGAFNRFTGLAASPGGDLFFITHGSGQVHRSREGEIREFGGLPAAHSSTILLAPGGDLFVTSWVPGALFRLSAGGGRAEAVVRDLKDPEGLALDAEGRLYIAETHGHRILRIWKEK